MTKRPFDDSEMNELQKKLEIKHPPTQSNDENSSSIYEGNDSYDERTTKYYVQCYEEDLKNSENQKSEDDVFETVSEDSGYSGIWFSDSHDSDNPDDEQLYTQINGGNEKTKFINDDNLRNLLQNQEDNLIVDFDLYSYRNTLLVSIRTGMSEPDGYELTDFLDLQDNFPGDKICEYPFKNINT
ncbi:hypothetical protein QAD02_002244 [Eretmocerus hayati]|uniref:Uncharacterized protein n=1 Tax=Eretmocerus hayati TaxID=131215 RepID=A0ACC2NIK2_9HYME|nr:hypothetical protein QAD02_002244 [Eretmocerus hayati]